ncbi:MAG: hypothetical protein U0271_12520 [Polyangiaceae bacterium]
MSLPVFYTPRMIADARSYSPSASKPAALVAAWLESGLDITVREPTAATVAELELAHDPRYVADILSGRRPNGFGNTSAEVASSLPFTTGAMLSAARHALTERTIACAPCSGFHHASYDRPAGFCTFNGLMVTALALHREGARSIGILDCDMHDGDGTDAILTRLEVGHVVKHWNTGARFSDKSQAAEFLAHLPVIARDFDGCDVVLYQAGADPHVDDPLGGWLTTEELRRRDHIVFETLTSLRIPVAWNLARGYQRAPDGTIPKVLEIHTNTALEALSVLRC